MVPHNVWDYDPASPPVLVDLAERGDTVPAVAQAGKTGWVYLLDRRTGARIRRSRPFVPQRHVFAAPTAEGVMVAPGTYGGSNWPSPAYSPATGALYVLGTHYPMRFRVDSAAGAAADSTAPGGPPHVFGVFEQVKGVETFGTFSAVDLATGKIRWQQKVKGKLNYGGALATAGGLVFYPQGPYLDAVDAATGEVVWRYRVEDGVIGPPISFVVDGEQRIAVTSTRGITVFGLQQD
jgi:glucose dehydrogenase